MLTLADIDRLAGTRVGQFDIACPACGPSRREVKNQRRRVLRVWRRDLSFASFNCARCGVRGHVRDDGTPIDRARIEQARATSEQQDRLEAEKKLRTVGGLWARRELIAGTIAETYLRKARGYAGPIPATLFYLPPCGDYPPSMLAPFGLATEPEPGELAISFADIRGLHLTRLKPDGSGKVDAEPNKIMLGRSLGSPIVLAPPNDLLGIAVVEGIEDGLSVHQATGLGVWAAGSASRLPALADAVPDWIECVTIYAHDDPDGQRYAAELAERLMHRTEVLVEGLPS